MSPTPVRSPGPTQEADGRQLSGRILMALSLGTFVEWFDFALYGFSSAAIAAGFFPTSNHSAALLGTFAIYGVSFVVRPVGGLVFGRIGDRTGRRTALSISLVLMGVATAAIGLLPSYATLGIAAPALLVLCRLLQGFAASSELTGVATYIAEMSPAGSRGLRTNQAACFGGVGTAAATLLVLLFRLSPGSYENGGWRWPFVIGGLVAVTGMYLRLRLQDPAVHQEAKERSAVPSLGTVVREHHRSLLVLFVFYALVGIGFQTLVGYMPTYMTEVAGFSVTTALVISLCAALCFAAGLNLFGHMSDRIGRKPIVTGGSIGVVVLTVPAYLLICTGDVALPCLAQALLVVPIAAVEGAGNIANAEIFPPAVRYSALALAYTVSYAVFAGTAPLLDDLLLRAGGKLLPAAYGVLVALIAVPVLHLWFPESRDFSIRTGRPATPDERK